MTKNCQKHNIKFIRNSKAPDACDTSADHIELCKPSFGGKNFGTKFRIGKQLLCCQEIDEEMVQGWRHTWGLARVLADTGTVEKLLVVVAVRRVGARVRLGEMCSGLCTKMRSWAPWRLAAAVVREAYLAPKCSRNVRTLGRRSSGVDIADSIATHLHAIAASERGKTQNLKGEVTLCHSARRLLPKTPAQDSLPKSPGVQDSSSQDSDPKDLESGSFVENTLYIPELFWRA